VAALSVAITAAAGAADLAAARALISEYFASNSADPDFSRCLVWQHAEAELAGLPGDYAPPRGRLLLARVGAEVAGCIALRPTDRPDACEMKRLFVRPAFRGNGVARALVHALLREAAAAGYRQMVLDTLPSMKAAQALYRELGFEDVAASTSHPVEGARYMTRSLAAVNDATPGS